MFKGICSKQWWVVQQAPLGLSKIWFPVELWTLFNTYNFLSPIQFHWDGPWKSEKDAREVAGSLNQHDYGYPEI
jgi:hypothetical protein